MKLKRRGAQLLIGASLALSATALGTGPAHAAHGAPPPVPHLRATQGSALRTDVIIWPGDPFGPYAPTPPRTDPSDDGPDAPGDNATWPPMGSSWPPGGSASGSTSQAPIVMPSGQSAPPKAAAPSPRNR
jgi:hypothetical protein